MAEEVGPKFEPLSPFFALRDVTLKLTVRDLHNVQSVLRMLGINCEDPEAVACVVAFALNRLRKRLEWVKSRAPKGGT
jgi:hypothetical protein